MGATERRGGTCDEIQKGNGMKRLRWLVPLLGVVLLATAVSSWAGVFVSVAVGPPALPVYVQPIAPGPGYIWTPGYWAWSPDGYYWVPGTWVLPPEVGFLWTPGYWVNVALLELERFPNCCTLSAVMVERRFSAALALTLLNSRRVSTRRHLRATQGTATLEPL